MMPAIRAVATATMAIEFTTAPSAAIGWPVIRLPFLSGTVPMIRGLSTMM